jgi:hypothetical protein
MPASTRNGLSFAGENMHRSIWSQICGMPKSGAASISSWTVRRESITPERRFVKFYELSLQCDAGDSQKTAATGDTRRRVTSAMPRAAIRELICWQMICVSSRQIRA